MHAGASASPPVDRERRRRGVPLRRPVPHADRIHEARGPLPSPVPWTDRIREARGPLRSPVPWTDRICEPYPSKVSTVATARPVDASPILRDVPRDDRKQGSKDLFERPMVRWRSTCVALPGITRQFFDDPFADEPESVLDVPVNVGSEERNDVVTEVVIARLRVKVGFELRA